MLQIVLLSAIILIVPVFGGTGLIRIDPAIPRVISSPADFTIWVQGGDTAYNPHIFLVMTQTSYNSFSGDVKVAWVDGVAGYVNLSKGVDWTKASGSSKLPPGTTTGAGYNIATLKSHLSGTTEDIWWAFAPILENPLDGTNKTITITFPATSPHMIVYILGKSENSDIFDVEYEFDMKVPPTIPGGFLIPEVPYGTIATLITMLGAFYVFYTKRA